MATRERIRLFLLECAEQGSPPTVREIGEAVGLRSPATVHQHLKSLETEGFLVSDGSGKARGWRLAATPKGGRRSTGGWLAGIPIVGRIAAGVPIDSLEEKPGELPVSPRAFASSGEVVALRVEGSSMVEAGILPGDFAIIRRQPRVENGEIAAVTVEGEGTLKRWQQRGRRVHLAPANRRFAPIPLDRRTGEVEVFGKLVGVFRMYVALGSP